MLLLSKGLVPPLGTLPSEYVTERVRARALASLGGPAHAKEAASGTAALALASADEDMRAQLGDVFDRAGLICERTADVVGVEMAGAAKNAASLAAAAAEPHGLNAAGIAAAEVWRECVEYATLKGASLETFSGLAGVGDLTATVLAPGSRNRRAGELLGSGVPAEQIPDRLGQASEGLDSVPLIAAAVSGFGRRRRRADRSRRADRGRSDRGRVGRAPAPGGAREERGLMHGRADRLPGGAARSPALIYSCRVSAAEGSEHGPVSAAEKAVLDRAFEDLYRAHLRDVYSYAYYRIGNHHDAEDLTEQTFLQAYRHFERAQRESEGRPLRPWLIRIAHNLASNYHRDRSRKPTAALDHIEPPMHPHGTERVAEGREELRRVMRGLTHLSEDRREALIMRFALGMSNREIARALGRSDGATKVLIHRSIKQLEEELAAEDGEGDSDE